MSLANGQLRHEFKPVVKSPPPVNVYPARAKQMLDLLFKEGKLSPESIISLGLGDCTVKLPPEIPGSVGAGFRKDGFVSYTPIGGAAPLIGALTKHLSIAYKIDLKPGQFFVSGGSRGAIDDVFHVVNESFANQERAEGYARRFSIGTFTPTWGTFAQLADRSGRELVTQSLPANEQSCYSRLTPSLVEDFLDRNPNIGALVIVNPYNPTGYALTKSEASDIMRICADRGVFVIEDATYGPIVHPDVKGFNSLVTAAYELPSDLRDRALSTIVSIYSVHKVGMSGQRLSFPVIPNKALFDAVHSHHTTSRGASAASSQEAALALINHPSAISDVVIELALRRNALASSVSATNTLFAQLVRDELILPSGVQIPDLIQSSTLVGAGLETHGGGFYDTMRFGSIVDRLLPSQYHTQGGELAVDGLWAALINIGVVTQPAPTILTTNPRELRASYGDADVRQIGALSERLARGFVDYGRSRLREIINL